MFGFYNSLILSSLTFILISFALWVFVDGGFCIYYITWRDFPTLCPTHIHRFTSYAQFLSIMLSAISNNPHFLGIFVLVSLSAEHVGERDAFLLYSAKLCVVRPCLLSSALTSLLWPLLVGNKSYGDGR